MVLQLCVCLSSLPYTLRCVEISIFYDDDFFSLDCRVFNFYLALCVNEKSKNACKDGIDVFHRKIECVDLLDLTNTKQTNVLKKQRVYISLKEKGFQGANDFYSSADVKTRCFFAKASIIGTRVSLKSITDEAMWKWI